MTQGHEQYPTQGHEENFFEKSDTQGFGYHFLRLKAGGAAVIHGQLLNVPMVLQAGGGGGEFFGQSPVPGDAQESGAGAADAEGVTAQVMGQGAEGVALLDQGEAVGLVQAIVQAVGDEGFIPQLQRWACYYGLRRWLLMT